jgi:hypothetical protein
LNKLNFERLVPVREGEEHATYGGDLIWASTNGVWSKPASVGGTWRGTLAGGGGDHIAFISAAHLRNPSSNTWFWAGNYPSRGDPSAQNNPKLLLEVCNGTSVDNRGDYQIVRMDASLNQPEQDTAGNNIHRAGGYYLGQPANVHGQHTWSLGDVVDHGVFNYSSSFFSCHGTSHTLATTAVGTDGDSGGMVKLWYANNWYLAGIYKGKMNVWGSSTNEGVSFPVWYIKNVPGYTNQRICTVTTPCN